MPLSTQQINGESKDMELKIGDILEFNYGYGNINNRTVEVKALFDDRVVVKTLKSANPNTSLYIVEPDYLFGSAEALGICSRVS
jgi:hypothetical protein